jgi:DnaJ-class molecular chaperone
MIDHYKILGVSHIASRDDVHKAFVRLAARLGSDRTKDPSRDALLISINEAHDVLSDPTRRIAYDFLVWKSPRSSASDRGISPIS